MKAQLRTVGDTAWVWQHGATHSVCVRLGRAQGQWVRRQMTDTTTAVPEGKAKSDTTKKTPETVTVDIIRGNVVERRRGDTVIVQIIDGPEQIPPAPKPAKKDSVKIR